MNIDASPYKLHAVGLARAAFLLILLTEYAPLKVAAKIDFLAIEAHIVQSALAESTGCLRLGMVANR